MNCTHAIYCEKDSSTETKTWCMWGAIECNDPSHQVTLEEMRKRCLTIPHGSCAYCRAKGIVHDFPPSVLGYEQHL